MIKYKTNTIVVFNTTIQYIIDIVSSIYSKYDYLCIITSGMDGTHKRESEHYNGQAVDFRTRHILPGALELIVNEVKDDLTGSFEVILESDHLHIHRK